MDTKNMVSVIIPTLNEQEGIVEVIEDIPEDDIRTLGYDIEVLVVDGGSTDNTVKKVKKLGSDQDAPIDIFHAEKGKAEGVKKGLKKVSGELVFLIDGDGSYPAERIPDMLKELENGSDMVLGSRFDGKIHDGAMSTKNKVGNKILTWLANRLYGTEVSDLCTGLRGFKKENLKKGEIPCEGFEIEAALHTLFSDANVSEIGIRYDKRKGTSKLKTTDGFKIASRLLKERFR
ncbi:MAG: glycosyltransferase family 2 protein [Candidatus Natronoplasma sp.]